MSTLPPVPDEQYRSFRADEFTKTASKDLGLLEWRDTAESEIDLLEDQDRAEEEQFRALVKSPPLANPPAPPAPMRGPTTSGVEQHRGAVQAAFGDLGPEAVDNMLAVMEKESGGNTQARKNDEVEDSQGILQINRRAHPDLAAKYDLTDPVQNARAAREIYDTQGYGAWFNASKQLGLDQGKNARPTGAGRADYAYGADEAREPTQATSMPSRPNPGQNGAARDDWYTEASADLDRLEAVGDGGDRPPSSFEPPARGAGRPADLEDVSQFDPTQELTTAEAYSACGPAAAVRFARLNGRNPTMRQAVDMAKEFGWTERGGMNGPANQRALMQAMAPDTAVRLDENPDAEHVAQDAMSGNVVTLSTRAHYYTVSGYDPKTQKLFVGKSGTDRKGGAEWMSLDEIRELDGSVAALFVDSPLAPAPSVATEDAGGDWFSKATGELDRLEAGQGPGVPGGAPGGRDLDGAGRGRSVGGSFADEQDALADPMNSPGVRRMFQKVEDNPSPLLGVGRAVVDEITQAPDRIAPMVEQAATDRALFLHGTPEEQAARTARRAAGGPAITDEEIDRGFERGEPFITALTGEPIKIVGGAMRAARGMAAAEGRTGQPGMSLEVTGGPGAKIPIRDLETQPWTASELAATGDLPPIEPPAISTGGAEKAGNIRPGYFPPEIRPLIEETVDAMGGFTNQRRGVVTDAAARKKAAEVALGTSVEDWVKSKPGRAFKQEEAIALGETMARVGEDARAARQSLREAEVAGTVTPEMRAATAEKMLQWSALVGVRAGSAAEAGRSLRAFRTALTGEGASRDAAIQRAFKQVGGGEKFDEWLSAFESIPDADKLAQHQMLRALHEPSLWDRIQTVRIAGMLSSTATQLTNAASNAFGVASDIGTKPVAGALDALVSRVAGGERTRYAAETIPQIKGAYEGFWTGLAQAGTVLREGATPDEIGKLEVRRPGLQSGSKVLDAAVEMPLRALSAADLIFRGAAEGGHYHALATRKALNEGVRGADVAIRAREILASITEHPDLLEEATRAASRTVLQEDRAVSEFVQRGKRVPGLRYALDVALPFVKTPYNIAAQGAGMTPAGYLGVLDAARKGQRGEAVDRATRATLGTAAMGAATMLAANGLMTGAYPDDDAERSTLPQGWQPWSLRIPSGDGAVYVEIKNLGPWAIPLAIGAVAGEAYKRGGDVPGETAVKAVKTVGRYMQDQTFLQGLNNIIKAIEEPDRYAENISEGMAASFMPAGALQRQVDRALGNAQRDPHGALEALLATSPLTSGMVREKLTPMGDPQRPTQTGIGAFVAPVRYGVEQDEPTLRAMREARVSVPPPADAVLGIPLTKDEQRRVQTRAGELLRERVAEFFDAEFESLPLADRGEILERVRNQAREDAGVEVLDALSDEEIARRKAGVDKAKSERRPLPKAG